jgi:hypothetical protein
VHFLTLEQLSEDSAHLFETKRDLAPPFLARVGDHSKVLGPDFQPLGLGGAYKRRPNTRDSQENEGTGKTTRHGE